MLANAPIMPTIPCVDITIARVFYGGTLGLPKVEMPGAEDTRSAFYQCGQGTQLLVYQRAAPSQADHTVASWIVDDIDAAADSLISKGVTLKTYPDMEGVEWDDRGVADLGNFRSAWFTDPDGNILSIAAIS